MEALTYGESIAAEVRAQIARAARTHSSIAEETGIPKATLSRKTTGKTPFNVIEVAQIAVALGIDPDDIFRAAAGRDQRSDQMAEGHAA
ncbi:helix-turn-helix domain-containing protein [Leifsonia sp. ZF2019]|uniref:helix-turn-helix domain-containing protein n=1 Tax=Leifsonia sp. ZF2019 TaxID=2781978 RepID=UPI001CBE7542|nr:helix-turn-helix transcriptional regulator [Leifsonia sp. ZF2019]UAJ80194.1 helix-turn-helix domain-containing protein [Leifsonia sp. ZF2019]